MVEVITHSIIHSCFRHFFFSFFPLFCCCGGFEHNIHPQCGSSDALVVMIWCEQADVDLRLQLTCIVYTSTEDIGIFRIEMFRICIFLSQSISISILRKYISQACQLNSTNIFLNIHPTYHVIRRACYDVTRSNIIYCIHFPPHRLNWPSFTCSISLNHVCIIWIFIYISWWNLFLLFSAGAFLIPFLVMLVLEGIPLFLIELGMGQRMRLGSLGVWNTIHPWLGDIGISSCIVTLFVALYYNVVITWCFFYLFNSFRVSVSYKVGAGKTMQLGLESHVSNVSLTCFCSFISFV